jgi:hypothetical protein
VANLPEKDSNWKQMKTDDSILKILQMVGNGNKRVRGKFGGHWNIHNHNVDFREVPKCQ